MECYLTDAKNQYIVEAGSWQHIFHITRLKVSLRLDQISLLCSAKCERTQVLPDSFLVSLCMVSVFRLK